MARISKEDQEVVKNKIIEVSRRLFNDVGFDKASTKMIAKETGIAEGTIFNYFSSKDEIFFEVFYLDHINDMDEGIYKHDTDKDIIEEINNNIFKVISKMLRMPKRVLLEMGIVTIKIAKKKPEFFKKMASMDFKYMEIIAEYLDGMIKEDELREFDTKKMSEIIFGILTYELFLYLYEKDLTKKELKETIKEKLEILLRGYIKGGN
ncbi:MAG: HTH-type transcriptional regulator AcrR [Candidatus Izimaplasma bacterium HR2]|nr:MAG: HTH-type transcriptional regulator AcrR [Candidatus Izimaplasma bacterium HR2]